MLDHQLEYETSYHERLKMHVFDWQMNHVFEAFELSRNALSDKSKFKDAAEAFAFNVYSNCEACPITGMTYTQSVCLLHYCTNAYSKEMEDEFNEIAMSIY